MDDLDRLRSFFKDDSLVDAKGKRIATEKPETIDESLLDRRLNIFSNKLRLLAEKILDEAIEEKDPEMRYNLLGSISLIQEVSEESPDLYQ